VEIPVRYPRIRKIVHSTYLDIIGAVLILGVCIYRNFHGTIYSEGEVEFGIKLSDLWEKVTSGYYPLGIMSTIGAVFSMLATRLVSKQNNTGNVLGVVTTVNSGVNDFLFGNASAIITYPITFITHTEAVKRWAGGERIRERDKFYFLIIIVSMFVAFGLVFLGAYLFGGKTDTSFLLVVSLAFGISLGGTTSNAFKYQETWVNWIVYNCVQLVKNGMLLNLANVVKYIFYLFNAALTLVDWKFNGDRTDLKLSDNEGNL